LPRQNVLVAAVSYDEQTGLLVVAIDGQICVFDRKDLLQVAVTAVACAVSGRPVTPDLVWAAIDRIPPGPPRCKPMM
jgi:hypothetical protein